MGEQLETFIACTTDETDAMEYIVVMKSVAKSCIPAFVGIVTDSSTPNFESEDGLIDTIQCSIDADDKKLVCQ